MLLDQHQALAVYLNLLQLAHNLLWNMDNLLNNQLFNHLLHQLQLFECYHLFLNKLLLIDQRRFFHQSLHCNILFLLLEVIIGCFWKFLLCVLFYRPYFQRIKWKTYFLLEILDHLRNLNIVSFFHWRFWLIFIPVVLLIPDFNCSNNFVLSWVDNVKTGRYSFVSAIANFVFLVIT